MATGTKLTEFEKSEIIILKRVGKSQREILKALGSSKTITAITWTIQISMEQWKPTGRSEKIIFTIQEKNCSRSKKQNFKKYWNLSWIILAVQE